MAEVDLPLVLTALALTGFGLLMVFSASYILAEEKTGDGLYFVKRQSIFAFLACAAALVVSKIPYRLWLKGAYPALLACGVLLAMVFVPGLGWEAGGAERWLKFGPVGFQPAELAKVVIVLFAARQLTVKRDSLERFVPAVGSVLLLVSPLILLLLAQPDFGSSLITLLVVAMVMWVGGVPFRFLLPLGAGLSAAAVGLVWSSPYRQARILSFMDPWADPSGKGFQVLQSMLGFAHGGPVGVGLGNGKEKLFFLPEAHNDFIFSVIGEELGLLGVAILIGAFLLLGYRGFQISYRAVDRFGFLLAFGLTALIIVQALVNMGVNMGLLPTKGLNLPLISYGGSALIMNGIALGLILSVGRESRSSRPRGAVR